MQIDILLMTWVYFQCRHTISILVKLVFELLFNGQMFHNAYYVLITLKHSLKVIFF